MLILAFDTETTGVANSSDPTKPAARVVQIAAKLIELNAIPEYEGINVRIPTIHTFKAVVDSEVDIPEGASNIHGITNDKMLKFGINHLSMLDVFADLCRQADAVLGHNVTYDINIMRHAFHLEGFQGNPFEDRPVFDTMRMATPVVKMLKDKPKYKTDYRWPKLGVAWKFCQHWEQEKLFDQAGATLGDKYNDFQRGEIEEILEDTVSNAHDAMIDTDMSLDIFLTICRMTGNTWGIE